MKYRIVAAGGVSAVFGVALCGLSGFGLQGIQAAPQPAAKKPGVTVKASDPGAGYLFLRGNTHAHTSFTVSHGQQKKNPKLNGPPEEHFRRAKAAGYDFYVTSDHSQEVPFNPTSPTNPAWLATKAQALAETDASFVAISGYEHSENNKPDGKGHFNVINSTDYLDALEPGVNLPYFYTWLKTQPNAVVSFNHPKPTSYNSFAYRDPQLTEIITLLEVINSNKGKHYEAFVVALDKGWKVSPVCGNDNHGFSGITQQQSRTVVLSKTKTRAGIVEAMLHRRTYATLDTNLKGAYTVNGAIMGSTLQSPSSFAFNIRVQDPDTTKPDNVITKLDIVTDGGVVVQTYTPTEAHSVNWQPTVENSTSKYFFVRIWNKSSEKPIAWLAPVWTGR